MNGVRFVFAVLIAFAIADDAEEGEGEGEGFVGDCLADIVRKINSTYKMSVVGSSTRMLSRFLSLVDAPRHVNAVEGASDDGFDARTANDLVVVAAVAAAANVLDEVLWNAKTRFFLARSTDWNPREEFHFFWKRRVANVFALVPGERNVSIMSFRPYGGESCDSGRVVLADEWSSGRFRWNLTRVTGDVGIKSARGCTVNVTVVDVKPNVMFRDDCGCNASWNIGGIEGRIMKEIARRLDMRARYVTALDGIGWGWIHPEPHGVVGEVYTGRSEFGIGLLAPTLERHNHLDLSVQVNGMECITYGLPRGAGMKQPTWISILVFEFEAVTWFLVVLAFLVALAFLSAADRILRLFPGGFDSVAYLFASCLGAPVAVPDSFTLRLGVLSWFVFAFVVTVAYRSSMGSKLTVPTPDPDIDTFGDLLRSRLQLNGYNNMLRLMQYNDSDADIKGMAERFVVTDFDINDAVDAIASRREMAHVRHATTFLYYILINPKAKGNIHLLRDCIYQYYPVFVMKKHSPFNARANQVITRLNEGGIVGYWRSKYIYSQPKIGNAFEKLSLSHTFGTFFVILLGYATSLAVFTFEILHRRVSLYLETSKYIR